MKLKMVPVHVPNSVVKRFPHLEKELRDTVRRDEGFHQLCLDYEDLIRALKSTNSKANDRREELLSLKTSLEVEVLERVSRLGT